MIETRQPWTLEIVSATLTSPTIHSTSEIETRVCRRCNTRKDVADYHRNIKRTSKTTCNVCYRLQTQTYKKKYRESSKAIIVYFKSRPCLDCGICYPPFVMDFHHREDEIKSFDLSDGVKNKSHRQIRNEAAKCDILCANCHRIRTNYIQACNKRV